MMSLSMRWAPLTAALCLTTLLPAALGAPDGAATAPRLPLLATSRPSTQFMGPGLSRYVVKPAYEKAIAVLEKIPTTRPALAGGTVFIGSSSFTRWKTLEKDMARFNAVNCGFGGSRSDDVLYYASRILLPLRPTRIVYYCGTNDLATTRPAATVIDNFKSFVAVVRRELPGTKIYFVSENVTPKRIKNALGAWAVNQAVAAWAKTVSGVYFIDARGGLVDAEGKPRGELFVKDGVHLNPDGYRIWMANIARGLDGAK